MDGDIKAQLGKSIVGSLTQPNELTHHVHITLGVFTVAANAASASASASAAD